MMRGWMVGLLLLAGTSPPAAWAGPGAQGAAEDDVAIGSSWDGLVEVRSRRLDSARLLPGADFRVFTRVIVEPPEVAMRRNWQRDVNAGRAASRRVTDADEQRILDAAQSNFTDIVAEAMTRAGLEVVTRPGPDVMKLRTAIVNIVVNAPDVMIAGRARTFTANAGEATLVIEVRDSETNELLAQVLDRRETRRNPGLTNRVTNVADFRQLFRTWSEAMVRGVQTLRDHSPIPDPLTPGQRLDQPGTP